MPTKEQEEVYNETKKSLESQIQKMTEVMELIDSIQHPKKPYTYQEVLDIGEKIKFLIDNVMQSHSKEDLALMLETKSKSRKGKNRAYNPIIISTIQKNDEKSDAAFFAEHLSDLRKKNDNFHYDVIFRADGHCTPCVIDSNGIEQILVFVDASGDGSNVKAKDMIAQSFGATIYQNTEMGTQKSLSNCHVFSNQDLTQMSKMPIETLKESFGQGGNTAKLHPQFIKNSQSQKLIENYKHLSEVTNIQLSNSKTLDQYLDKYSVKLEFVDQNGERKRYEKNYSILYKKDKFLKKSLELLNTLTPAEFETLVQKRNGYDTILNQKISYIRHRNPKQMKLISEYKVIMDLDRKYECFDDNQMTAAAFKYITQDIPPDQLTEGDKIECNERFNQIKHLLVPSMIKAVVEYGLPADDVGWAECFGNQNIAKTAFLLLDWAKNRRKDERKVFNKIRNTTIFQKIPDNIDYKIDKEELLLASTSWGSNTQDALKYIENAAKISEKSARETFNKLENLNNISQFKAAIEYGLNVEDVKNAPCFSDHSKIGEKVFQLLDESQPSQQDTFNQIKNLTNEYQLESLKYGIDPNSALKARCFQDECNNKQNAVLLISKAYEAYGREYANNIFEKIKDLNSMEEFNLVTYYGLNPTDVKDSKCLKYPANRYILPFIYKEFQTKGLQEQQKF